MTGQSSEGSRMSQPFIFVTRHRIKEGKLEELRELNQEFVEFVEANEPRLLAYYTYVNEDATELSIVQVHEDAASFAQHMQVAAERIHGAIRLVDNDSIQIFGPLIAEWRAQLHAAGDPGLRVSYAPEGWGGFSRAAA